MTLVQPSPELDQEDHSQVIQPVFQLAYVEFGHKCALHQILLGTVTSKNLGHVELASRSDIKNDEL